ncbi:MAG: hypothetical protein IPJ82_23065 [Lewinellaceae bacterium]|nr:hypothetical protein [Lewinellaceae bacterium]
MEDRFQVPTTHFEGRHRNGWSARKTPSTVSREIRNSPASRKLSKVSDPAATNA